MGRGPSQADATLFGDSQLPSLRRGVADLGWLYGRGYVDPSAVDLVGNRYRLRQRQRVAISRSAASQDALRARRTSLTAPPDLRDRHIAVDAFNVLIGMETALAGGVLLRGVDSALRDLSSVHGSYRRIDATATALEALCKTLISWQPASVSWFIDRPVSNSGRLAGWIRDAAPDDSWNVELPHDADREVIGLANSRDAIVCSSDAWVLDESSAWADLLGLAVAAYAPDAWVVDLRAGDVG